MIVSPVRDVDQEQELPSATIQLDGQQPVAASPIRDGSGESSGPAGLACRRLRVRDLRFLISSVRQEHLDQPDSYLNPAGALSAGLRSLWPFTRGRPATSLAFLGDRFAGYVQFDERGPDRRWIATDVGISTSITDERPILDGLLEFSVKRAGSRSVKRLFARVAPDSERYQSFLACGFEQYMDESVHVLNGVKGRPPDPAGIREQDPADTWAVHQLYHAAVPKHVQYAEAWTSHRWDVKSKSGPGRLWRAFVMEAGYQMIAYAGVRCANGVAAIRFMYLPERTECVPSFVRDVIGQVSAAAAPVRIYVAAPGYQQELRSALGDQGFQEVSEQHLLIKYTTAKVSARVANAAIGLPAEVLERVPKQVPTYLKGPVREEKPA